MLVAGIEIPTEGDGVFSTANCARWVMFAPLSSAMIGMEFRTLHLPSDVGYSVPLVAIHALSPTMYLICDNVVQIRCGFQKAVTR